MSDNLSVILYGKDDLRIEQTSLPDKPLSDGIFNSFISFFHFSFLYYFLLLTEVQLETQTGIFNNKMGDN